MKTMEEAAVAAEAKPSSEGQERAALMLCCPTLDLIKLAAPERGASLKVGLQTLAELLTLCYSGLPSCCATQRTFSVISDPLHL